MLKQGISFHSTMKDSVPDFQLRRAAGQVGYHGMMDQGPISERGFTPHMLD